MTPASPDSATLDVRGMWCTSCANALERVLQRQPGTIDARVSFASESATLEWDPRRTSLERLLEAAAKLGYVCEPESDAPERRAHTAALLQDLAIRLAVAAFCSMWVMTAQTTLYFTSTATVPGPVRYWLAVLAGVATLPVVAYCAQPFFRAAWRTLRARVPGMDCLVAMGASASCLLSIVQLARGESTVYFDSAAMIVTFLLAGRWLETRVRSGTADAVRTLLELPAQTARVLGTDGSQAVMLAKRVSRGSIIRVLPGERLPLDGIVTEGRSSLDRSLLTGESEFDSVGPGSFVEAGTLNAEGELLVRVNHEWGERRVDAIARSVRTMLARKTASQAIAERFTRRLVPGIALIALLVFCVGALSGMSGPDALERAVAVLVITCPCALGMAVPLALGAGVGRAARAGILFRDVEAIEKAGRLSIFFLDKTGTLTEGKPHLVRLSPAAGVRDSDLVEEAALAERGSEHPIAAAIRALVPPTRLAAAVDAPAGSSRAVPGAGVEWHGAAGQCILAGTARFLRNSGVAVPDVDDSTTAVHVARDGRWRGMLGFADRPREGARRALAALRAQCATIAMLTGDREQVARAIAEAVGIGDIAIFAAHTPEQKAARIVAAQRAGNGKVAFVGDGLNDAPALAAADVGIAVGSASPASMAAASIVLVDAGVEKLEEALFLARRTARVMHQNLAAAAVYNALAIPLAVAGFVSPATAAALMVASSLSVTFNAARLAGRARTPSQRHASSRGSPPYPQALSIAIEPTRRIS
ncbi:cation-translocating P-type ATPase [Trinickia caryophylli]|uniref:Copper-(Or silver)-translocating P-type ATPase n=1 Tax=Trinickia caryophylli TaxID=28094 RepID=A0A1X7GJL9_TRICW|nr:cation-translocating P-type ATPase [Trinickia caryophylli]PMS09917.1 copper-translocating P-type ATPase [Trinickia caryophylli]TRX14954.1 cation-translocating P-type ATPase [Trinickia caryophylli]WQE14810.1 cation-translocating P-type ATPase [Trinickia caryophylli]SMF70720.1 copper-(or silver)-translocating P-type ATPase [Trinickia caryophylli]GLU35011.1 copper-translocating P-type ATPase [Trinickia caryophylli]